MDINDLSAVGLEEIVTCLLKSFENYFVKMPSDVDYWEKRFIAGRVDFSLSCGIFDDRNLVGFIVHGIDEEDGIKTAFNNGTGILPNYRGKHLVDRMYNYTIPRLKNKGIQRCKLEVIQENKRAIHVYKRIGFDKLKSLYCFKGSVTPIAKNEEVKIESIDFTNINVNRDHHYAWECQRNAVILSGRNYSTREVYAKKQKIGYFIIDVNNSYLVQYELYQPDNTEHWIYLFQGIRSMCPTIKINNVDVARTKLIAFLNASGFQNTIKQYEMYMDI